MNRCMDRRSFIRGGIGAAVGLGLTLGRVARSEAMIWVPRDGIMNVLQNWNYFASYSSSASYMVWDTGGTALDQAIRSFKGTPGGGLYCQADRYQFSSTKAAGTRVPDGQCVALVRACTMVGPTAYWYRGVNVMNPGSSGYVPIGAVIARFSWSSYAGRYVYASGHTALFAGYRSAAAGGGIAVWHQNVEGEFVTMRSLPRGGVGWANPDEYYVVVR
jgi:hypothetical protein